MCKRRLFPGNDPADKELIKVESKSQANSDAEEELKLQEEKNEPKSRKTSNSSRKGVRGAKSEFLKIFVVGGFVIGTIVAMGGLVLTGLYIWRTTDPNVVAPVVADLNPAIVNTKQNIADGETPPNVEPFSGRSGESVHSPADGESFRESSNTSSKEPASPSISSNPNPSTEPDSATKKDSSPASSVEKYDLVDLIEKIEPSVVRLDTGGNDGEGIGSGVFVGDRGLVVTNYHVVQGANSIKVTTRDGRSATALGFLVADPLKDLAVIKIGNGVESHPISLAETSPRKGTEVAAFGAPLGFSFSASEGVISATRDGTEIQKVLKDLSGADIYRLHGYSPNTRWIQTTSAISGGNSGGPLVDMSGHLVGINTWKVPKEQGLNFAAAVDEVKVVMNKAKNAIVKPFRALPSTKIRIAFSRDGNGRALTPREKAARDIINGRRNAENADIQGSERIEKGEERGFEPDSHPFVSRSFTTEQGTITGIKVSLDGRYMAANTRSGFVFMFDIEKGKLLYQIESEIKIIRATAFSQNPTRFYTLRDQGETGATVAIRDPEDGQWKTSGLALNGRYSGATLAVSNDGRSVFGNWKAVRNARFWRFDATGDTYKKFDLNVVFGNSGFNSSSRYPHCSAFTPDGTLLITGFVDGWISSTSGAGNKMNRVNSKQLHVGLVNDIAISSDNKRMASVGEDGQLQITTLTSRSWSGSAAGEANGEILGVAFSSDGQLVAITRVNRTIEFYNPERRKLLKTIEVPEMCTDLEFMRKDRFIIAGGKDGTIRIIPVPSDIIRSE